MLLELPIKSLLKSIGSNVNIDCQVVQKSDGGVVLHHYTADDGHDTENVTRLITMVTPLICHHEP